MHCTFNFFSWRSALLFGVLAAFAAGCGNDSGSTGDPSGSPDILIDKDSVDTDTGQELPAAPIEIAGNWVDDFGGTHEITDDTWTMGEAMSGVFHISRFENEANWLVAHNDANNDFSPSLWSRFDWTWFNEVLYFCQSSFDSESEEQAMAVGAADPMDPTTGGCGGFAWSKLAAQ